MSEKWVLVPVEPTHTMCDQGEGYNLRCGCPNCDLEAWEKVAAGYTAMLSAVPPIPDDVWSEMVERGKRAVMALDALCSRGHCSYPVDCMCEADASACLRAALGIDRAEKGEG